MTAVSWSDARRIAHGAGAATRLPVEHVALGDALGRHLAADVRAAIDIPHFASSAMDGWAVAGDGPWRIRTSGPLAPGEARPVLTGEPVGSDVLGVLRSEFGDVDDGMLRTSADAKPGEPGPLSHVRRTGREARAGDVLLHAGTVLDPVHLAVAAAATADTLPVHPVPEVAVVTTGDEVTASGVPAAGRVRDSFGPMMPGVLASLGGLVRSIRSVGDDPAALRAALDGAAGARMVVTTGGTGHSHADHVRRVVAELGADVLVPRLALRPGGPGMLARLPDDRWVVALPGNPFAAIAALLTLGAPLVAGLTGRPLPPTLRCTAASGHDGRPGATTLLPVRLRDGRAEASGWRGSGMLRGLADADALLVVPSEGLAAGAAAAALPLPWRHHDTAAAADGDGRMGS